MNKKVSPRAWGLPLPLFTELPRETVKSSWEGVWRVIWEPVVAKE